MEDRQTDIFNYDLIGLSNEEVIIWKIIREYHGKERAIKEKELVERTGIPGVKVRSIISHLVCKHKKLIGSSTANPAGFYIITDEMELERNISGLRRRGIKDFVRAAALAKTSIEDIFNQGKLELEETKEVI
jgi:hypothetical protein